MSLRAQMNVCVIVAIENNRLGIIVQRLRRYVDSKAS